MRRVNTLLSLSDMTCTKTNPEVVSARHVPDGVSVGICTYTFGDGGWACGTNPTCVRMHACLLCVEMWMIIAVYEQSDATPPMYPSPKMGQMHEREMKSLNLVVGNGIRKHWPFVGSLRPWSESHDSQIFTVPPVTGLVKSQHTSLKPSRPKAGLQLHRQMQRCFFFFFPLPLFSLSLLQPRMTRKNTRA